MSPIQVGIPSPSPDYPQAIEQVDSVKLNIRGKNLCDGINQNYYLNNNLNICGKVTDNSGLAIDVQDKSYITVSTKITQNRYRIACTNKLLQEEKATTVAYRGVQKDNTSATITINTTGYNYLIINATDLGSILAEDGSVATEYEPYKKQTVAINLKGNKLCAVSDTIKDKLLIDKSGNVALQKNVSLIILNKDNIVFRSVLSNGDILYRTTQNIRNSNNIFVLCNYYRGRKDFSSRTDGTIYCNNPNRNSLATPEIIDLGQLPELPKTFNGINNIWAETNLGNTEIEIEYVQDVKKLLEKQAEQQNARLDNIETLLNATQTSALLLDNMQEDLEKEVE